MDPFVLGVDVGSQSAMEESKQAFKDLPETYTTATLKAQQLPESFAATDCKSLFDLITKTATPSCAEFRTQLDKDNGNKFP